jgi:hypothetical protein
VRTVRTTTIGSLASSIIHFLSPFYSFSTSFLKVLASLMVLLVLPVIPYRLLCKHLVWFGLTPHTRPYQTIPITAMSHPPQYQYSPRREEIIRPSRRSPQPVTSTATLGTYLLADVAFDATSGWCDACTRSISSKSLYYSCQKCVNLDLCGDCYERGFRCRDQAHALTVGSPEYHLHVSLTTE